MRFISFILIGLIATVAHAKKPNIVLIMVDDFGVGNVNAYGASKEHVRTPNIDMLAEKGMKFTDANTPGSICSPTRYALLTGEYAWREALPFAVVNVFDPMIVKTDRTTFPKYMQKLGYQTAQIGKWHLGYSDKNPVVWTDKLTPGPNDVGFDYHFGLPQNLDDMMRVWIENDMIYGLRSKKTSPYSKSYYGMPYLGFDAPQRNRDTASQYMTDRAVDWIQRANRMNPDKPFFLYFAPAATHHPIVPSELMRGSSGVGAYGDFIQELDHQIGQIIQTLQYEGIDDETLIIFTADNGADLPPEHMGRPETQALKAGMSPNGINKGDKHTVFEGGVRVPLIIRWDGKVEAGSESDYRVNIVDLYSTVVDALTGELPTPEEAPDSVSFKPTLFGEAQDERPATITSNAAGLHALRIGPWKYLDGKFPEGAPEHLLKNFKKQAEPMLFNLEADPSEKNNIIASNPEIVERLQGMLDSLRAEPTRK